MFRGFRRLALIPLLFAGACAPFARGPDPAALLDPASPALAVEAPPQYFVEFETTQGEFVVEVNRDWAPRGADRFFNLVRHGFYNGAHFFRVLPDFVVQFGLPADPALSEIWTEQRMEDDPVTHENLPGTVSFASAGPDTRTTQVFINLVDNRRLDGLGFTPFGRVIEGMDVVRQFYSGYGEGPPRGRGPDQGRIESEGAAYLSAEYPELDSIVDARIVDR